MYSTKIHITLLIAGIMLMAINYTTAQMQASEIDMTSRYQVSRTGSYITFSMKYNGLPVIKGSVVNYQGTIFYDDNKPEMTSATFRFKSPTISSHHEGRDEKLASSLFLDIENFPEIWFQSFGVEVADGNIALKGNLIVKDISNQVVVNLKKPQIIPHMPGSLDYMLVEGTLTIDRMSFGLGTENMPWNLPGFDGSPQLSHQIEVQFYFTCYSYNLDYLKSTFTSKLADGQENPVSQIFNIITSDGLESGIKAIKALKKKNVGPNLFANIGWMLMSDGRAIEAIKMYEKGLETDPDSKSNRLRLGDAYVIGGFTKKAIKHYEKELKLNPALTHMPEMLKLLKGTFMTKSSINVN